MVRCVTVATDTNKPGTPWQIDGHAVLFYLGRYGIAYGSTGDVSSSICDTETGLAIADMPQLALPGNDLHFPPDTTGIDADLKLKAFYMFERRLIPFMMVPRTPSNFSSPAKPGYTRISFIGEWIGSDPCVLDCKCL